MPSQELKEKPKTERSHGPVAVINHSEVTEDVSRLAAAILATAKSLRKSGKIYQTLDMYFKLVEDFPSTKEANLAKEQLFSMAGELEARGKTYMAMGIYHRLENPNRMMASGRPGYLLSPMGRSSGTPLLGKIVGSIL
jgi:hypothetical protein